MNLDQFRAHIMAVDDDTLRAYHEDLRGRLARSRSPARQMGYAIALDDLTAELEMRRYVPSADVASMSDDELLAALGE
jgi:hypothetical protein